MKNKQRAFTLIEMMIVVAIIALLASIALPSYKNYIRKAKRATAAAALMDLAAKQQAYLLDRREYASGSSALTDLRFTAPSEISSDFSFTVTNVNNAATPPTFTVNATPTSTLMLGDTCGITAAIPLALDQSGAKTPSACWQK